MAPVVVAEQESKASAGLRLVLSEESTPNAQLVELLQAESGAPLLIASNAAMLERWREPLVPWPAELAVREVWLGASAEEAAWYSYNDSRCNGSKPLQQWQALFPNLLLKQVEIKPRLRLEEVLAHWQQHPEGLVVVHGERGSAGGVVAGLGVSCARVGKLELTGCDEISAAEIDALDQQLWEQGALERRDGQLIWERNEEETFRRTVLNERDALVNERDALVNERDALVNERDALVNERDALVNERDALVNERDALVNERDALVNERDALVNERDALMSRLADCDGRMERFNTELDEILALIDSAYHGEATNT